MPLITEDQARERFLQDVPDGADTNAFAERIKQEMLGGKPLDEAVAAARRAWANVGEQNAKTEN